LLDLGEGCLRHRKFSHHLTGAARIVFERFELRGLAVGLGHHAFDILIGDAEFPTDLHVVGELVFGFLHPADLQDRQFAQARVELAVEADVAADAVEGAGHVGRVHQQLVQVGVALEHVAVFGGDLVGFEIGQAGHFVVVLVGDSGSGSPSHRALCAPARSWRRNP
jgi:hypothetical protein